MTTCRDIVQQALRFARVLPMGDEAEAGEAADAMDVLSGLFDGWWAAGEFGCLTDKYVSAAHTAVEQERVTRSASETITLPESYAPDGQVYKSGDKRAPYELSAIEVVGASRNIRDQNAWVDIDSLTLDSAAPLVQFGKAGLSAALAIEIADQYDAEVKQGTIRKANRFITAMRSKRLQSNPRATAVYF